MCLRIAQNVLPVLAMRSHAEIVRAIGAAALTQHLNSSGFSVHPSTPQRWADRNSIPGEYWSAVVATGKASLDELAAAAAARRAA